MSTRPPSTWQLHEAKARFSELFRRTREVGPQRVLRRGGEAVVVLAEDFDRMTERAPQPSSLVEFSRSAPTGGKPLDLARKRDVTRALKR